MARACVRDASAPDAKRSRVGAAKSEEFQKGVRVIYDSDRIGIIHDVFAAIDEFWVEDLQSEELVRDEEGNAVAFKSSELRPMLEGDADLAKPPAAAAVPQSTTEADDGQVEADTAVRVLVLAKEEHMVQMLEQFGSPCYTERREPQLMLAVPVASCKCGPDCNQFDPWSVEMCSPDTCPVTQLVSEGTNDEGLQELARSLRPDLDIQTRVFELKQAFEQLGPDLRSMDGYFCLASVTLPYSHEDIGDVEGADREYRQDICCQIDVGVSATGVCKAGDGGGRRHSAWLALHEACGVDIAPSIWCAEAQFGLRRKLGIDLLYEFSDGNAQVFVVILPEDATHSAREDGALCYEAASGAVSSQGVAKKPSVEQHAATEPAGRSTGGKCVGDWKLCQDEFSHLGKLPRPWIFIRSARDKDIIYYLNTETQATTIERPLPAGWTKQTSKSTGKTYYFHAERKKSMFEIPPP